MTVASAIEWISPLEKKHREYLCILATYTNYEMPQIVKLLNLKFRHDRQMEQNHRRFHEGLTNDYWKHMSRIDHETLRWARAQGAGNWRVKRVLKWAEEQDI